MSENNPKKTIKINWYRVFCLFLGAIIWTSLDYAFDRQASAEAGLLAGITCMLMTEWAE